MSMDRRKFLKVAGLSTLIGLSGKGAFELLKPGVVEAEMAHGEHGHDDHHKSEDTGPKVRWAMLIDVRALNKEKVEKIVKTCHHLHNVPNWNDPKNEIKWIWEDEYEHVFTDSYNEYNHILEGLPFLLMCNHCDNPPCVRVCPVQATFRRPDGLVAQDYHRCIGCRFCMAACPYGSRSFNWLDPRVQLRKEMAKGRKLNKRFPTRMRGVVEKCNFCVERLAEGKQPGCVEAAPDVMFFGNLADPNSQVRKILRERISIRRKLELGTRPSVFYLI